MPALLKDGVLTLDGPVGPDLMGEGFTAGQVALALATIDDADDLTVHINSPGGYADDGTAIYNALRARAGNVHIIVTGVAASAASLIVMAGDRKSMAPGSVLMAHEPMVSFLNANSADIAEAAQAQASYTTSYVKVYASGTGKSEADVRAMLASTVWFDADAAVAAGFADDVFGDGDETVPPFDYTMFHKAPDRLVAMAKANGWDAKATAPKSQEPALDAKAEKARADAAEAEVASLKTKLEFDRTRGVGADGTRFNAAGLAGRSNSHRPAPRFTDYLEGNYR